MKSKFFGIYLGLILTLICAGFLYLKPRPLELLKLKIYDTFFQLRGKIEPSGKVVIAAIDEKSIKKFGRWPWRRRIIARLIRKLSRMGAKLIFMDIIFSEPHKDDPELQKAMEEAGNVLLPVVFSFKPGIYPAISAEENLSDYAIMVKNPEKFEHYPLVSAEGVLMPVKRLVEACFSLGHINIFPDIDGTVRRELLYIEYQGFIIPALTLKTAAFYKGIFEDQIVVDPGKGVYLGKQFIPTDESGRILIPYYGPIFTFKYYSIADILEDHIPKNAFKNKIILIGPTAVGIYDLRVTPFSPVFPGVEKHANVIEALISGRLIKPISKKISLSILLLLGTVLTLVCFKLKSWQTSVITFTMLITLFYAGYFLFAHYGLWFDPTYPGFTVLVVFVSETIWNYTYSEKKAREIRRIFASYVTERIVKELIKNPELTKLGGERREVTVLFSDIRGFTSLSESLPPEEVVSVLNEYFEVMTEVIFRHEGTLDKFIGDAIMVFWGAPLPQPDHAQRAVKCALEMVEHLKDLHNKWKKEGKPLLRSGIGINTGEVLVGNIGAEGKKMDYTVIGDHVNLASRLEGLTKKFKVDIIISEYTLEKIKSSLLSGELGAIIVEGVGVVAVKGKEKPVKIYRVAKSPSGKPKFIEVKDQTIIRMKEK